MEASCFGPRVVGVVYPNPGNLQAGAKAEPCEIETASCSKSGVAAVVVSEAYLERLAKQEFTTEPDEVHDSTERGGVFGYVAQVIEVVACNRKEKGDVTEALGCTDADIERQVYG